ncbi:MAG: tyrosine-type recombinase/integrase [Anaerovorax sp.]
MNKAIQTYSKEFLEYCKFHKRLSPTTIRAYGFDLKCFHAFLETQLPPISKPNLITKQVLENYLESLHPYAVKTIRRKMATIQSLFTYLEYEEVLDTNPFHHFKLTIKETYKMRTSMTLEEVNAILKAAYSDVNVKKVDLFLIKRNIAVLEFLFAGGMRVAELCAIKLEDLDLEAKCVLIHGKGNKERFIYLENEEVVLSLKRYLALRPLKGSPYTHVFISKDGNPISTQAVRNLVTKYTKLANIKKNVTPHIFRHTFATLLLEEGVDIKYIQDFLGHSSISTTQLYLHTTNRQKRNIMATLHPRKQLRFR